MITLTIDERITFADAKGQFLVQSTSEERAGLSGISTSIPPLSSQGQQATAMASASADGDHIAIGLSGGAQSPGDLVSANVSAKVTIEDTINVNGIAETGATQTTELSFSATAQGLGTENGGNYRLTFNGQITTISLPPGSSQPVSREMVTPADLTKAVPLSLTISDQMLFGNGEGGGRSMEATIMSISFRTASGTPLAGFTYSTASGNLYNIIGGVAAVQVQVQTAVPTA